MFTNVVRRFLFVRSVLNKTFATIPQPSKTQPPPQILDCVLLSKDQVNHNSYIYKFLFFNILRNLIYFFSNKKIFFQRPKYHFRISIWSAYKNDGGP